MLGTVSAFPLVDRRTMMGCSGSVGTKPVVLTANGGGVVSVPSCSPRKLGHGQPMFLLRHRITRALPGKRITNMTRYITNITTGSIGKIKG